MIRVEDCVGVQMSTSHSLTSVVVHEGTLKAGFFSLRCMKQTQRGHAHRSRADRHNRIMVSWSMFSLNSFLRKRILRPPSSGSDNTFERKSGLQQRTPHYAPAAAGDTLHAELHRKLGAANQREVCTLLPSLSYIYDLHTYLAMRAQGYQTECIYHLLLFTHTQTRSRIIGGLVCMVCSLSLDLPRGGVMS